MKQYLELMQDILDNGIKKEDRTGTGTLSLFGRQLRFDLSEGFPLLTTKKLHIRSIIYELLWFLRGDTNIKYLNDNGVHIWDEWSGKDGELGPIYGKQWRSWPVQDGQSIDQISKVISQIKSNPNSRRLIVSAWNVGELDKMALEPCHTLFQFYVADGKLSCQLYQRSADVLNHLEQAKLQLTRTPYPLPKIRIKPNPIFAYQFEDFEMVDYQAHPHIKAPIAV